VEPSTVRVEFVSAEGRSWIDVMAVLFEPDEVEVMTDEALSVLSREGFPADICGKCSEDRSSSREQPPLRERRGSHFPST